MIVVEIRLINTIMGLHWGKTLRVLRLLVFHGLIYPEMGLLVTTNNVWSLSLIDTVDFLVRGSMS